MRETSRAILEALAYHDLFCFPLTAHEIRLALPATFGDRPTPEQLIDALEALRVAGRIASQGGFWCLPGREATVEERHRRYVHAEEKYTRVMRYFRWARFAPFLRAAFVCNTLARSNARPESDIDFYLVAAPGRVWLVRLVTAGLASLLRLRPKASDARDGLCFSFYVTTEALGLRRLAIEDDVYLAHWMHDLAPVYDEAGVARRSFAENGWVRERLPDTRVPTFARRRTTPVRAPRLKRAVEGALDALGGDRLERWARARQLAWMPAPLRRAAEAQDTSVVLDDDVLKFHDEDRRAEFRARFRASMRRLGTEESQVSGVRCQVSAALA